MYTIISCILRYYFFKDLC
uniref:Uncharacterized protein n=1 Tax=Anguilla anguilla TaxID=7936 RepID=A0A0E9XMT0_ANGAN